MALGVAGSNPVIHPNLSQSLHSGGAASILGCSQAGKAPDFDSGIPQVRVLPAQPINPDFGSKRSILITFRLDFFFHPTEHPTNGYTFASKPLMVSESRCFALAWTWVYVSAVVVMLL